MASCRAGAGVDGGGRRRRRGGVRCDGSAGCERCAPSRKTRGMPADPCAAVHTEVFIGRFAGELNAGARGCGRCGSTQAGSRRRRRLAAQLDAESAIAPGAKWPVSGGAGRGRPAPARCTMAPSPLTRRRPHHGQGPTFRSFDATRDRGWPPWARRRRVVGWRVRRVGRGDGGRRVGLAGRSRRRVHFDVDALARGGKYSRPRPGVSRRGDGDRTGRGGRRGARGPPGR